MRALGEHLQFKLRASADAVFVGFVPWCLPRVFGGCHAGVQEGWQPDATARRLRVFAPGLWLRCFKLATVKRSLGFSRRTNVKNAPADLTGWQMHLASPSIRCTQANLINSSYLRSGADTKA